MQLTNSNTHYGWIAIILHWVMALAIIAIFVLGWWMTGLDYYDRWYHDAPSIHQSIGMLLLMLLLFRFAWRLGNARPQLMGLWWEQMAALVVQQLHYLLLLIVMITGYLLPTAEGIGINIFGWFTVPATLSFDKAQADLVGDIHWWSACAAMALIAVHSAAALKHHFVDRDPTLLRMVTTQHPTRKWL
ncbi:MAG: cytochrome b [Mariprofundales bacterium]|nr:cytochrome b [Mariprofundales bacterium]